MVPGHKCHEKDVLSDGWSLRAIAKHWKWINSFELQIIFSLGQNLIKEAECIIYKTFQAFAWSFRNLTREQRNKGGAKELVGYPLRGGSGVSFLFALDFPNACYQEAVEKVNILCVSNRNSDMTAAVGFSWVELLPSERQVEV